MVCLEGPSAVGKTSLAETLARIAGAAVVTELAGGPPAGAEPASWFVAEHAAAWGRAQALAASAPLVVLDGDPFKGLWYDWVYASDGAPALTATIAAYADAVARGALDFPDMYVVLKADEAQLRMRRAGDPTRTRRNFERHLQLVGPQQRYFAALAEVAPDRLIWIDTADRDRLPERVLAAAAESRRVHDDAAHLLRHMASWVETHSPAA